MQPDSLNPQTLSPGDRYHKVYRDQAVVVEILRHSELHIDRFGQSKIKYWARRVDTGAEGWVIFGPGATSLVPA